MHLRVHLHNPSHHWPAELQHLAGLFLIDYVEKPFIE